MESRRHEFDTLSADYERFRPRYPTRLLQKIAGRVPDRGQIHIIDAGAGTGIALEGLVPLLGPACRYEAIDLSPDMVATGRGKFPEVQWSVGPAESFLEAATQVDLIVAAQSFQWMDRPRFLRAAAACLNPTGVLAIIQNNRNFMASPFLDAYETLLEELSPGYRRHYRSFDFAAELRESFTPTGGVVEVESVDWTLAMTAEEFLGMARSSTQVTRALNAHGDTLPRRLETLAAAHANNGELTIPYRSELFTAKAAASRRR